MKTNGNIPATLFADIVDEARYIAGADTELHKRLTAVTDKDVLLADNASSLVATTKRCRELATDPRLLNADIDVLRQQLRVIANLCRVSLDMIDPDLNSG